jgi:hypothetical protein
MKNGDGKVLVYIFSFLFIGLVLGYTFNSTSQNSTEVYMQDKTNNENFISKLRNSIFKSDEVLLSPGQTVYFISPDGSDSNSGTFGSPWKNLERVLGSGQVPNSSTIYLMGGEYRINAGALKDVVTARKGVSGNADRPFIITSFFNQRATLLLSERAPNTWQTYNNPDGKAIYYLNWRAYVDSKSNSEWYTLTGYNDFRNSFWNPQGVFVHGNNPISLRQVNSSVTGMIGRSQFERPISVRNNQTDMQAGDYYLEMNPSKADYGRLFVWLPDNGNPNSKQIEIATDEQLLLGSESEYLQIYNLDIRYSNFWGLTVGGHHNKIEGVGASYNGFTGLDGRCSFCSVSNSSFNYNGNTGSNIRGKRTVIENSVFDHNNWQRYLPGFHCGGMKLIECDTDRCSDPKLSSVSEMVIRNNTFTNTHICGAVWFDWAGYGNIVENNLFINNSFGVSFEASNGTKDRPNIVRNNVFIQNMEGELQEWLDLGVYPGDHFPQVISSSSIYTDIIHNTFYQSRVGVTLSYSECGNALDPGNEGRRRTLTNNNVLNNLFLNVTIPVIPRRTLTCATPVDGPTVVRDNVVDYNLFHGSWISIPYLQNRQIGGPVVSTTPRTQIIWCDDFGLCDLTLADWQARGYDRNSVVLPTTMSQLVMDIARLDFRPLSNGWVANRGTRITARGIESDREGLLRNQGQAPDIGAYESKQDTALNYPAPLSGTSRVWITPSGRAPFLPGTPPQPYMSRPGAGTQADPYQVNTPEQFSTLMQLLPPNLVITFLPGTYYTYGFSAGDYAIDTCTPVQNPPKGWMPKVNWTIEGAGIDKTNITLVGSGKVGWNTPTRSFAYSSILGTPYNCFAHGLNVRDMTLDANFHGQDSIPELSITSVGV